MKLKRQEEAARQKATGLPESSLFPDYHERDFLKVDCTG